MIAQQFFRSIHTNYAVYSTSKRTLLSKLRKKTGFAFVNCKQALEQNDNDIEKAEIWLKEMAQSQGWSKAEQLHSRLTTQGLIAMVTNNNHGSLVEINCETDFVARNKKFHDLAETVLASILKHGTTLEQNTLVNKNILYTEQINKLCAADGKNLGDHSALTIGVLGENIKIRRALCMNVQSGVHLYGCTHPAPLNPVPSSFGRYGVLIALKSEKKKDVLGMQLCQHIIGMNPSKVGDPTVDEPSDNIEDEPIMLYQEFLFDQTLSIQQLLQNEQVDVMDFVRFEVGEILENNNILNSIETCG